MAQPADGRLFTSTHDCGRLWLWFHGCQAGRLWKNAAVKPLRSRLPQCKSRQLYAPGFRRNVRLARHQAPHRRVMDTSEPLPLPALRYGLRAVALTDPRQDSSSTPKTPKKKRARNHSGDGFSGSRNPMRCDAHSSSSPPLLGRSLCRKESWHRRKSVMKIQVQVRRRGEPGEVGHQMSRFTHPFWRAFIFKISEYRKCNSVV